MIKSEMIKYRTGDDEITGYLAQPGDGGKHPGVVLIHEIFGLDEHTKDVAGRLAAEGYVVLAPHLFSSRRLSKVLTAEGISETMKFMMSLPIEKQRDENYRNTELQKMDDKRREMISGVYETLFVNRPVDLLTGYLSSGVDYLSNLESASGKMGSVGFCFGGGMSINLGCTGKTDASVIFYGDNPDPIDKVKDVKGAVMGLYGGEDTRINSKIDELVKALAAHKKSFTIKMYPGAHHAFFNDTRPHYNDAAAKDAWHMLLDFFDHNL